MPEVRIHKTSYGLPKGEGHPVPCGAVFARETTIRREEETNRHPHLGSGPMDMAIRSFVDCIGRAVLQAEFTNARRQRFDSSVMHKLYTRKTWRENSLSDADTIS